MRSGIRRGRGRSVGELEGISTMAVRRLPVYLTSQNGRSAEMPRVHPHSPARLGILLNMTWRLFSLV